MAHQPGLGGAFKSFGSRHRVGGTIIQFQGMVSSPIAVSKSLPYWAQLLSFLFAALGFLGAAFIGLTEYLRTAELDTKLTKDCFYRLMDQGEAIFCRVTVIARNGPVLIRDVNVTLTKTDGAQKTFPLDVIQFGTLLPKPEKAFQEHNY